MITLLIQMLPLRKVVRSLLFNIRLCVGSMGSSEFLLDWVLDSDSFDLFAEVG
jgi:hypothetical protein